MATAQVNPPDQPSVTPVPTPGSTASPASPSTQQVTTPGAPQGSHNVWTDLVFAFIGTAALALIASLNERLGRVLLAIMVGFLFMWFLMHAGTIAGWVNNAVPQAKPGRSA